MFNIDIQLLNNAKLVEHHINGQNPITLPSPPIRGERAKVRGAQVVRA
jgi:hypothetical protein